MASRVFPVVRLLIHSAFCRKFPSIEQNNIPFEAEIYVRKPQRCGECGMTRCDWTEANTFVTTPFSVEESGQVYGSLTFPMLHGAYHAYEPPTESLHLVVNSRCNLI
uniref:COesterase domain-containing protein n=1 Tax=Ascaris lumbricoides TaxID=6252 RepID=A0A0M3I7Z6_ASCLU